MGFAYYVVLERNIPGFNHLDMSGKAIASNIEQLGRASAILGLPRLEDYVSVSPDQMAELLGEDDIEPEIAKKGRTKSPPNIPSELAKIMREANQFIQEVESARAELADALASEDVTEQWFDADAALRTVSRLIEYVRKNSREFDRSDDLLWDLGRLNEILEKANGANVRFHLAADF